MGKTTKISWSDATFNPWIGCFKVSPGCKFCYAEREDNRYGWTEDGWGKGKPRHVAAQTTWGEPIKWANHAVLTRNHIRIFCASLSDVLDEEVPGEWRWRLWNLIERINDNADGWVEWLLLTKRIENAATLLPPRWLENPPKEVRLGVSVEDQEYAQKRIPELLRVWKGKNFLSVEPMLAPVSIKPFLTTAARWVGPAPIDWIICGGESHSDRRMDLGWARDLRDECRIYEIPFFMKQLGGMMWKQDDPAQWPTDLQIQQFPVTEEHHEI